MTSEQLTINISGLKLTHFLVLVVGMLKNGSELEAGSPEQLRGRQNNKENRNDEPQVRSFILAERRENRKARLKVLVNTLSFPPFLLSMTATRTFALRTTRSLLDRNRAHAPLKSSLPFA